ncbi:MAG: ABC transporter ATP-binding protein [Deltaproteobacteria bacterium]|nr:ABC transporter ATP-binding protein [Deltaproteobacteria bacterium]
MEQFTENELGNQHAAGKVTVAARGLSRTFDTEAGPVTVLEGVSFELSEGDAVAVVGPSGSGKSTLLHILGTLDSPSSGELKIHGRDPFSLGDKDLARFRNRSVGFVFQDHYLLPQYSLLENVLLPTLAFPGGDGKAVQERGRQLLERVGLSHRLDHRPAQLSGGERQRGAIARAMIAQPGLLLCDEPTGNLDQAAAGAVTDLLFELHRQEGTVLVVVTHSAELAGKFPRRLEMRDGRCAEA